MSSVEVNPTPTEKEPELHLLLAADTFQPLWKSLFRGLDDFFFPKNFRPSNWNRSLSRSKISGAFTITKKMAPSAPPPRTS